MAIGIHSAASGMAIQRSLNDLDFVASRFEDIPETLANEFLFRHVHPHETSGRTMMQLVDADAEIRIDLFGAVGGTLGRGLQVELPAGKFRVVALEDLIARVARLLLDLADGAPAPAKHAEDFLFLSRMLGPRDVQPAWSDHRKPNQPASFAEVRDVVNELIRQQRDLLVKIEYSKDAQATCERCIQTSTIPLTAPDTFLAVLGYC
jgi:hypothetical protein